MGIPAAVPVPSDPFISVYPSMAPKATPPAPKPSITPAPPAEPADSLADLYPSMTPKAAQPPASAPAAAVPAATRPHAEADGVDPDTAAAAQALAKELNLPSEQAARLLEHHRALSAKETARWTAETEGWDRQLEADPEIGGSNREASMSAARALMQEYATPELLHDLAASGYGSHPGLVRFVVRVAKAMGTRAGQKQIASLYPSMPNP